VVRHRRTVLSAAVIVTSGLVALALLSHGVSRALLSLVFGLLVVLLAVLGLVAYFRPRQGAFVVDTRTPTFRTLPHEGQMFATLTVTSTGTEGVLGRLSFNHGLAGGPVAVVLRVQDAALWVLAVVVVALAAVNFVLAWRGGASACSFDPRACSTARAWAP
jgi:hypothetical protein